jgi:hypothetical protein
MPLAILIMAYYMLKFKNNKRISKRACCYYEANMKIINVPDLSNKDDAFTNLELREEVEWVRLTGLASNMVERHVKGIKLSRYRAAVQAALVARQNDVVISHHPLMSNAVAIALRGLRRRSRHIAFAFNFTAIPSGSRLRTMSSHLSNVEAFVVFSKYEKALYSNLFGIEETKFSDVLWAQDPPLVDSFFRSSIMKPFVCAIGGEGRDVDIVLKAAEKFKEYLDFVIITRPHMVKHKSISDNVHIFTNLDSKITWAIAEQSVGVLVPLVSEETCCGHITIVSAKLLGLPIVTTRSLATEEYVQGRQSILMADPRELTGFCDCIGQLVDQKEQMYELAQNSKSREIEIHSRKAWAGVLNNIIFDQGN